eukprot:CAMPEP_0170197350 /NCGR_PEP_ID=MMETSP0040_2-20121228/66203_1 /TAXON_ID=641309 /ORGANISM="Lotharella oceanica, Strain CCMP622" /LENGTH=42 /DNA_ID= /DNA_START= /DNA_END= /DNA_ORIENTATION=
MDGTMDVVGTVQDTTLWRQAFMSKEEYVKKAPVSEAAREGNR